MADLPDEFAKLVDETITKRLRNLGVFDGNDLGVIRTRANFEFVDTLRRKIGLEKLQSVVEYVEDLLEKKQQRNKTVTDIMVTAIGNSLPVLIPLLISAAFTYWVVKK